jgi:hypothetical protein
MKIKGKTIEQYSSRDLMNVWYEHYEEFHSEPYTHREFGGMELRHLKILLQDYDVYSILLAIENGIRNGEASIKYFAENIEQYIIDSQYVKYHYLIKKFAPKEMKEKLVRLSVLDTKWFPDAQIKQDIAVLIEEFDIWLMTKNL